jgi:PAS domain S-box-containing protein
MPSSKIETLLIEDNLAEADLVQDLLSESRQQEFSVQHVQSLAEGLSLLREKRFDIVIVDLGLPDSQGLETALTVRRNAKRTPVIALTFLKDEDVALRSLQMDIQDYLIKGEITGPLLIRSIRYAIQRKRDVDSLRESEQRFASFMSYLPAAAWMKDMLGRYVYANEESEHVFSKSVVDLIGKPVNELPPSDAARVLADDDREVLKEGGLQTIEVLHKGNGIDRHYIVSKFVVPGPDGESAYVAGVAFDITECTEAQDALRASEEKFSRAFNAAPILVSISTLREGRYIEVNTEFLRTLGFERHEVVGHTATELGIWEAPGDRDLLVQIVWKSGKVRDLEARVRTKTGSIINVLISTEIIDVQGEECLLSLTRDITELRKTEEDRARLASIVESSDDAIISKSLDGIITSWNKGAEKMYGFSAQDVIGKNISILMAPDNPDEILWILERVKRGEILKMEVTRFRKDATPIPVSLTISPIKGLDERIIGASAIARDISDIRQTLDRLRAQAELLDLAHDAIIVRDKRDIIRFWNRGAKETYGWTSEEATGQLTHELLKTRFPKPLAEIAEEMAGMDQWEGELTHTRKDGQVVIVASRWAVQQDESGYQVGILEINRDITHRKRAEEEIKRLNASLAERAAELETANQDLEAFNYTVAHDLRQPLNVISGYCQALKMLCGELRQNPECMSYVEGTYQTTLRMNGLIAALLNFARLAHVEPRQETVDLSAMAQTVAEELKQGEPGRQVDFRIADGVAAIGDANLLRVVLDNLFGNAWKYTSTRDKAVIEFGVTTINGTRTYFVRDNGLGFDMSDAENVFTPFKRLPGAERSGGFGIGLATVRRVIQRHGGKAWAEGGLDEGACFYFSLGQPSDRREE